MIARRQYIKRSTKPIARRVRPRRSHAPLWAKRVAAKLAGTIDPDSWQDVLEHFHYRCAYCQTAPWSEQDHVRPIARGGQHAIGNCVPSCRACNVRKGTQTWPVPRPHRFMETA